MGLIEEEASQLVRHGEREKAYGSPRENMARVASMWSVILGTEVRPEQVPIMMIAFKLARLMKQPQHHDSKTDVIGWTVVLDRMNDDSQV